jgi:hypothetical protein
VNRYHPLHRWADDLASIAAIAVSSKKNGSAGAGMNEVSLENNDPGKDFGECNDTK